MISDSTAASEKRQWRRRVRQKLHGKACLVCRALMLYGFVIKWSKLFDCLKLKTKSSAEVQEILEAREKEKHHIWSFRTPEEAAAKWHQWYGHLDEPE